MNTLRIIYHLARADFHERIRRYSFLLMLGLVVCAAGLLFGLMTFNELKNMPVHPSMREVSELIYET